MNKLYKIETFIPKENFNTILNKLYEKNFGNIGNYSCCMNWYEVNSSWKPNNKANPYQGKNGLIEQTTEIKLEFRCTKKELKDVINTIKTNHPYEEVCINIIPMKNI